MSFLTKYIRTRDRHGADLKMKHLFYLYCKSFAHTNLTCALLYTYNFPEEFSSSIHIYDRNTFLILYTYLQCMEMDTYLQTHSLCNISCQNINLERNVQGFNTSSLYESKSKIAGEEGGGDKKLEARSPLHETPRQIFHLRRKP